MPYPYTPPEFLQNQSADEIHRRMMNALPDDIDKSELQIPWDFTRPAALEKAEFVEFEINESIKIMFVLWAYGEWLDLHAQGEGLVRRPANRAFGKLTVTATAGTIVEKGFLFATPANLTPSVIFEAMETVVFDGEPDSNGQVTATVPVLAAEGGTGGNVPPDTIILMVKPQKGIVYISNPEAATGGATEEGDDELRERILDSIRRGISFTGCDADYVRWAKEVPGVGNAFTEPEWAGPGTVRVFAIDANGHPANPQILDAVYNHIISPDDRMARLAPIGATLTVAAPSPRYVDIEATVVLKQDETLEVVRKRFEAGLDRYWLQASTENDITDIQSGLAKNYIKYVYVGATLAQTAGIANYNGLTVNGATDDILIRFGEYPVTRGVTLHE